ncbi:type II toxin-antitoxin system RelE family toxin [Mesorhizobium sp. B1-1-8]|uniref:type II toxin-antitoxin system RelE family toxin n=1 Tax=Mesorhizobium sp. B1-1-8 TaxID=2589976 RepID=UPI0011297528|nr:type II toxin-antitoxin system RelE/ParE family toxin [Mesorhizobium sp. B1-1-8]UCI05060.1 type II toxin-antitoxin system RelE/ParE family toxin [Mesorhizobium sp. B1-1-8]
MKTIVLAPAAAKALDKMSESARVQITEALHAYAMHGTGDAKAMVGTPTVRLRSGDYRVIFDEAATTITVLALGNRREIYR